MEEIKPQDQQQPPEKGQIRIDESAADTSYANFFLVSTTFEEFILSFGVRTADAQTVRIGNKVIVSPKNFKRMAGTFAQSLKLYEDRFGAIDISMPAPEEPPPT